MRFSALNAALAAGGEEITVFFRDDDAGWADARLLALLDVFRAQQVPLDLAVIPCALSVALAAQLRRRCAQQPLGMHQHGYAHINHEPTGRKCEFGPARSAAQQTGDVLAGQLRLRALLGSIDAIFTPPWNRCSQATVEALRAGGIATLSRDHKAAPLKLDGLRECPVQVDWCKWTQASLPAWQSLDAQLARYADDGRVLGIMLHHAVMSDADLQVLQDLIHVLRQHPRVHLRLMRETLIEQSHPAQA